MTGESSIPDSRAKSRRWAIWGFFLALWTFALVTPFPIEAERELLPEQAAFPTSKTLHVGGYAFLTCLSAWLQVSGGWRWGLPIFLVLHGGATELLQCFVPLRTGSWIDVGLDAGGVFLGLALSWRWWREPQPGGLANPLAVADG
jgi:VanZ family protein